MKIKLRNKIITCFLLILVSLNSCDIIDSSSDNYTDFYKNEMRYFVMEIAEFARSYDSDFIVIPQNGQELITKYGNADDGLSSKYVTTIDGQGSEDLYYGYNEDNVATPAEDTAYIKEFLDIAAANGKKILVTDYCRDVANMDDSYAQNDANGIWYVSFAADERDLNNIPTYPASPHNENALDISTLADASNFLYLLDPGNFDTKQQYLAAINATNYDIVIIDLFYNDEPLTKPDVASLKIKANGGKRLVICYMSIGEAEDYRYYWDIFWSADPPSWLLGENLDWEGNYKVKYWDREWKEIIYGSNNSYLKKIVDAGFDGVYLDIIDAFEYFEYGD